MAPVPIIVCGKVISITKVVADQLMPNYDVIHVHLSVDDAKANMPLLLSGTAPPPSDPPNPGSQHYGTRPAAIVLGGGFNDEMVAEIKGACGEDSEKLPWFRADTTRQAEMPELSDIEEYGKATAVRLRKQLEELKVGQEGGVEQGTYFF